MRARPNHLVSRRTAGPLADDVHVIRPMPGARNEWGEWVQGGYHPMVKFRAVSSPVARRRETDESGARLLARRKIISHSEVSALQAAADGDLVYVAGDYWRAVSVARWSTHAAGQGLATLYDATVERLEDQDRAVAVGLFRVLDGADPGVPEPQLKGQDLLERSIRRYVAAGSGLERTHVIPANAPGPAPDGVFATVLILRTEQMGHPYSADYVPRDSPDDVRRVVEIARQSECSVQFHRTGALEAAKRLSIWTATEAAKRSEVESAFRLVSDFTIMRLDERVGPSFEERASLDLTINHVDIGSELLSTVCAVPLTVETARAGAQTVRIE